MSSDQNYWKKCSTCKRPIPFSSMYYVCSVSTCRHKRKGFQFCSVQCWDGHLGYMNHREAWAVEERAPSEHEVGGEVSKMPSPQVHQGSSPAEGERRPVKKIVSRASVMSSESSSSGVVPHELQAAKIKTDTLVVVSKVKKLIKDQSDFNTSQCCIDALTRKVVAECLKAIEEAKKAERKTVMGRDVR